MLLVCKENTNQRKFVGGFFSSLSNSALEDFGKLENPVSYPANATFVTEGDTAKTLFVVLEGQVRLSINSKEGKRLCMRIANVGDLIGLSSVVSGSPYDISAETMYSSKVASISRRDFLDFLANHPDAYRAVTEELGRYMSMAYWQLRTVALSTSVPEKLARLLLEWSDRGQSKDSGSPTRIALTHEDIGNFIGASRETVTRTLSAFKSRQLVNFRGSMMTIPNRTALEEYAHA